MASITAVEMFSYAKDFLSETVAIHAISRYNP